MSAQTKIAVYSLADLKNTTDDALPVYLTRPPVGFKQSHFETDVRLALGYTAVIIAGALFYLDWKQGWEVSKPYTTPAVVVYFVLNAAFTYWIWGVERGTIFVGWGKGGEHIRLSSQTDKHTPVYKLDVTVTPPRATKKKPQTYTISAPFASWFTADGYFIAKPFQQWLASNVSAVGAADPNNVVEEIGRGSGGRAAPSSGSQPAVFVTASGNAAGSASGGGRNRKKG